jgi:hypothetical protein
MHFLYLCRDVKDAKKNKNKGTSSMSSTSLDAFTLDLMRTLKISPNPNGDCYGFARMALYYWLMGEYDDFSEIMSQIKGILGENQDSFAEKVTLAESTKIKKQKPSQKMLQETKKIFREKIHSAHLIAPYQSHKLRTIIQSKALNFFQKYALSFIGCKRIRLPLISADYSTIKVIRVSLKTLLKK